MATATTFARRTRPAPRRDYRAPHRLIRVYIVMIHGRKPRKPAYISTDRASAIHWRDEFNKLVAPRTLAVVASKLVDFALPVAK